ncbi:hypothetical protein HMI55_001246 [Coelomomyces lativittatus]|nr:hypothetical protein HMI55_001246 [Coelomomyces lativittatus]
MEAFEIEEFVLNDELFGKVAELLSRDNVVSKFSLSSFFVSETNVEFCTGIKFIGALPVVGLGKEDESVEKVTGFAVCVVKEFLG